jgi:hypothetical protein
MVMNDDEQVSIWKGSVIPGIRQDRMKKTIKEN